MKSRIGMALAIAAVLTGCGREPGVFDIGLDEAYRRLVASRLPDMVFARQCGILVHVYPEGAPRRSVTWRVFSSGREMVNFTATLTAVGDTGTRAEISISKGPNGQEHYNGSQTYPRPAFRAPLRPAVEEQVAALLEGRDYDGERVPRPSDPVCNVQRAGLEAGHRFSVNDQPGTDSQGSAAACQERRRQGWGC